MYNFNWSVTGSERMRTRSRSFASGDVSGPLLTVGGTVQRKTKTKDTGQRTLHIRHRRIRVAANSREAISVQRLTSKLTEP